MHFVRDLGMSGRRDAWHAALDLAHAARVDRCGTVGYGVAELVDGDGRAVLLVPFGNLITDAGDLYNAGKLIVGIGPAAPSAPTAANGMKLGNSTTASAKSGTGAALVTYLSGSNVAFAAGFAQTANLGAGLGVNAVYQASWAAGTATSSTINEAAIVNDAGTNATSVAANTYSRSVFSTTINKGATDTLQVTWNHKQLGA